MAFEHECNAEWKLTDWLIDWVKVLRPTRHKIGHFGDASKPISWLGMEKQNLTQQKHAFTNQNKIVQHKINTQKTKTRFSRLLRPGNGEGLFQLT